MLERAYAEKTEGENALCLVTVLNIDLDDCTEEEYLVCPIIDVRIDRIIGISSADFKKAI